MATSWKITFTGKPTQEELVYVGSLVSGGMTGGRLGEQEFTLTYWQAGKYRITVKAAAITAALRAYAGSPSTPLTEEAIATGTMMKMERGEELSAIDRAVIGRALEDYRQFTSAHDPVEYADPREYEVET